METYCLVGKGKNTEFSMRTGNKRKGIGMSEDAKGKRERESDRNRKAEYANRLSSKYTPFVLHLNKCVPHFCENRLGPCKTRARQRISTYSLSKSQTHTHNLAETAENALDKENSKYVLQQKLNQN